MNKQQMIEKYQGIVQFQCEFFAIDQVDAIIPTLVSLLDFSFDPKVYQQKKQQKSVYYTKSKQDPRCLFLIEFSDYFRVIIIRFPKRKQEAIRKLLQKGTKEPLRNTLIHQSMMNRMVKRYQLAIDIVDEYDLFTSTFQQKSFWNEYVKLNNVEVPSEQCQIYPELMEPIRFQIAEGVELFIETGDQIHQTMLFLKYPSLAEKYELGWDDLGHWHPHVLRWEELEKIAYYLTIQHPDHFVVPFLLLLPFAPITKEEDERAIARKIKAAWRSLKLFNEEEIETFDRQIPYMPDFVWNYSAEHDVYYVDDPGWNGYSKRYLDSDFPFQAFGDMLRIIESYQQTDAWKKAVQKWEQLIQQFSTAEDEDWFHRRETADWYHTSRQ